MADRERSTPAGGDLARTEQAALGRRADLAVPSGGTEFRAEFCAGCRAGDRNPAHRPGRRPALAWAGGIAAAAGVCAAVYLGAQTPAREVLPATPGSSSVTPAPAHPGSRAPGPRRPLSAPPMFGPTMPFEGWHIIPLPVHPPPTTPGELPKPTPPPTPPRVPDLTIRPAQPPGRGGPPAAG